MEVQKPFAAPLRFRPGADIRAVPAKSSKLPPLVTIEWRNRRVVVEVVNQQIYPLGVGLLLMKRIECPGVLVGAEAQQRDDSHDDHPAPFLAAFASSRMNHRRRLRHAVIFPIYADGRPVDESRVIGR